MGRREGRPGERRGGGGKESEGGVEPPPLWSYPPRAGSPPVAEGEPCLGLADRDRERSAAGGSEDGEISGGNLRTSRAELKTRTKS